MVKHTQVVVANVVIINWLMLLAVRMHLESLESTQETGVVLGYPIEQLLRFSRTLQTSRAHLQLDLRTPSVNHIF